MKKVLSNKKVRILLMMVFGLVLLSGCQRNMNSDGTVIEEKIIYLTTSWSTMKDESIFTAIFVWPLAQVINLIDSKINSCAGAVVITTVLFNILTLGLTYKSTLASQKMTLIQPEMNRIQDKYAKLPKDTLNQQKQAAEMQNLYSKYGINPMSSLIMPFVQLPIMIAMYYAVQRAYAVVDGSFMGIPLSTTPMTAIKNIATMWPIVLIFVCMIACQFAATIIPTKIAEKRKKNQKGYKAYTDKKSDTASQTQMMTYSMVAMIGFIGLNWPSAMSLYWMVSSACNIIKTLFIQWRYIDNAEVRS